MLAEQLAGKVQLQPKFLAIAWAAWPMNRLSKPKPRNGNNQILGRSGLA